MSAWSKRFDSKSVVLSAFLIGVLVLAACAGDQEATAPEDEEGQAATDASDEQPEGDSETEATDQEDPSVEFPQRNITFVVPFGTGGSTDLTGRTFSELLGEQLDATVVVENREGGAATIGVSEVVNAEPDGHTIGLAPDTALANAPLTMDDLPYEDPDDYTSIGKLVDLPLALYVQDDAPWETLEDLVQDAADNPGDIRVAVSALGTTTDLNVQAISKAQDVELTSAPFTGGGGEGLTAILSGQVEAYAGTVIATQGHVDAGTLRALTVFSEEELDALPDAPPVTEVYPEVQQFIPKFYVVAPPGLPTEVEDLLVETTRSIVEGPEFSEWAWENGFIPNFLGSEEMAEELVNLVDSYRDINAFLDR